jgi:hypothetical protein
MKAKSLIRLLLLIFVIATVAILAIRGLRSAIELADKREGVAVMGQKGPAHQVVAFYFHGTVRCLSCKTLEAWAREGIERDFSTELQAGTLQWQVVDVDKPENKHFVQDYQLVTRSLVLVELQHGKVSRWSNLSEIWTLLDDKPAFMNYVRQEVGQYMRSS